MEISWSTQGDVKLATQGEEAMQATVIETQTQHFASIVNQCGKECKENNFFKNLHTTPSSLVTNKRYWKLSMMRRNLLYVAYENWWEDSHN